MLSETAVFAFGIINTSAVLFLVIYFMIVLSDLECDYLNVQECCSKLNFWAKSKLIAITILGLVFLLEGYWLLFAINLPIIVWLTYEFCGQPVGNLGVYDPSEILNGGIIKFHIRNCMICAGHSLTMIFIYMYCFIVACVKNDPVRRHENDQIVTEL